MSTVTHSWEEINTHKHTTGERCWWHAEWRWRSVKRSLRYKSSHRHKFVNIGLIYPTANTLLLIVNSNLNFPFCSSLHNECIQLSKPELWNILIVKSYGQMSLINSLSLDWRIFFFGPWKTSFGENANSKSIGGSVRKQQRSFCLRRSSALRQRRCSVLSPSPYRLNKNQWIKSHRLLVVAMLSNEHFNWGLWGNKLLFPVLASSLFLKGYIRSLGHQLLLCISYWNKGQINWPYLCEKPAGCLEK